MSLKANLQYLMLYTYIELFPGKDGSRAFVSGDFTEKGLVEDLARLSNSDILGLQEWNQLYKKDYKHIGMWSQLTWIRAQNIKVMYIFKSDHKLHAQYHHSPHHHEQCWANHYCITVFMNRFNKCTDLQYLKYFIFYDSLVSERVNFQNFIHTEYAASWSFVSCFCRSLNRPLLWQVRSVYRKFKGFPQTTGRSKKWEKIWWGWQTEISTL